MLRFLFTCVKTIIFSIIILILGNWIKWDGKTLSEQVNNCMTHQKYMPLFQQMKQKSSLFLNDLHQTTSRVHEARAPASSSYEEISPSEKQKLRTLIKELKLRGSSGSLKQGTRVKNIRLVDGDHEISCKIDGIAVGLKACFVKKLIVS